MWQNINTLIKTKANKARINLEDESGTLVADHEAPDYINTFFATIGPNLAKKFENTQQSDNAYSPDINQIQTQANINITKAEETNFQLTEITTAQLLTEVRKIDIFKSSGIRDISSRILKDAMLIMLEEFTYLFNLSINKGQVPNNWKIATVIPIPKIANSTSVSDLRPISLLPLPGKILEKFVHTNLMDNLLCNDKLSKKQFDFRPGISTLDAIATLIDGVGLNLNNNNLTIAVV